MLLAIDVTDGRGFAVGFHRDQNEHLTPFILTACGL